MRRRDVYNYFFCLQSDAFSDDKFFVSGFASFLWIYNHDDDTVLEEMTLDLGSTDRGGVISGKIATTGESFVASIQFDTPMMKRPNRVIVLPTSFFNVADTLRVRHLNRFGFDICGVSALTTSTVVPLIFFTVA